MFPMDDATFSGFKWALCWSTMASKLAGFIAWLWPPTIISLPVTSCHFLSSGADLWIWSSCLKGSFHCSKFLTVSSPHSSALSPSFFAWCLTATALSQFCCICPAAVWSPLCTLLLSVPELLPWSGAFCDTRSVGIMYCVVADHFIQGHVDVMKHAD